MNHKKTFSFYLFLFLIFLLPKRLWSFLVRKISNQKLPTFLRSSFLKIFVKIFSINMNEAEKPLQQYKSFNEVFTRKLKKDARPIANSDLVSPVDSRVLIFGKSEKENMLQVKEKELSIKELLLGNCQDKEIEKQFAEPFYNGNYLTLYLSPSDYHRIHSPATGTIYGFSYIPGNFFPVNKIAVQGISNLFNKNERWTTFLQTEFGKIAIVKVAATAVGNIPVNYEENQKEIFRRRRPHLQLYQPSSFKKIKKAEELARFELGSTVVLLWEKDILEFLNIKEEQKINYGSPIANQL